MSYRSKQLLLGALLLALVELLALAIYGAATDIADTACDRALTEVTVFDACVKTGGFCTFSVKDLQKSADNLKYFADHCT